MSAYFLRRDGCEYRINDQESMLSLCRAGLIREEDRLRREGEKRFRVPNSFKELRDSLQVDTWEAWEALGDTDPDALWASLVEWVGGEPPVVQTDASTENSGEASTAQLSQSEDAAPDAITQEEEPVSKQDDELSVESDGAAAAEVQDSPELPELPEQDEDSNVIVFPTPDNAPLRRQRSNLQPKRDFVSPPIPDFPSHPAVRQAPPPRSFRAFPWVFGAVAVLGGITLWVVQSYVTTTANWTSPAPEAQGPTPEQAREEAKVFAPSPAPEALPTVADATPQEEDPANAVFQKKTEVIRANLSRGVREMKGKPDDFKVALLIEMTNMVDDLVDVDATVLAWGGPQNELPKVADIYIEMIDRQDWGQIAAAVLVVGKYLQAYELELTKFEVGLKNPMDPEDIQGWNFSGESVLAVYNNRMSMKDLLLSPSSK